MNSNVYKKKVDDLGCDIELQSLATPLLAPMMEEGFFNNSISEHVISNYLSDPHLQNIRALILACTHYPLIKDQISMYYQQQVEVLDSSDVAALELEQLLHNFHLAAETKSGDHHFYVSDFTTSFEESTRIFFKEQVHLEHYPLWE